jgi:ATP-dependent RNA helicase SUPV3L1/SUV3
MRMAQSKTTAVLGPTNTGKTHLAVLKMLASPTGMIGLPLRLLAREIYDRAVGLTSPEAVALITGEEKIVPVTARYWVCTVEAMPSDIDVDFLAIDEIQLATDFERGHVFTDRILHRRGRSETMLLGAQTMRPLIEQLIPKVRFESHPRLSRLTYAGQKKISRLPRRSATVAFSAEAVYGIAELIRRQRGGAAVVLGALSPRTRNAQVALYQNGDVDHIVATDAIGMGLNMDIDHVAFAATRKFDGFQYRELTPTELAQIAGRAGRYMNDGTFGVTGQAPPFDPEVIDRLENYRFEAARVLQWRNHRLSFGSIDALRASLSATPRVKGLTRAQPAADIEALEFLARDDDIQSVATNRELVELLWDVCQIPDYRNISSAEHANLVRRVYRYLTGGAGRIPADWFARQLSHCARTEGDIDTLSNRIAHVRTWTFIANRPDWLDDAIHWQERAREIEDSLSDALHDRLTQRFVDRRTAVLMKRLHQKEEIMSVVEQDGAVMVEGECAGHMAGLRFRPSADQAGDGKAMRAAVSKAVGDELQARAQSLAAAPDPDFSLGEAATIVWQDAAVARLRPGSGPLKPDLMLIADDELPAADREAIIQRLRKFLSRHVAAVLEPLVQLSETEELTGVARGLAFRLVESFGIIARDDVAEDVRQLSQDERGGLRRFGVRFGAFHIFIPALLKPAAAELRILLWTLQQPGNEQGLSVNPPPVPGNGLTSAPCDSSLPEGFYRVSGFRVCGNRIVRIDMIERLADMIRDRVFWRPRFEGEARPDGSVEGGGFTVIPDMMSLVGCSGDEFTAILTSLGYRSKERPAPPPEQPQGTDAAPASADTTASQSEPAADDASTPVIPATDEAGSEPAPDGASEAPEEPRTILVWWPKDTGPFKRQRKPQRDRQPRHKEKPKTKAARKHNGPRQPKPSAPKPPLKDSPFAVLSSLKADLSDKQ